MERKPVKEGTTMDKLKDAEKLLDLAFDESFELFGKAIKVEKKVDRILDALDEADWKGMAKGAAKSVGAGLAVSGTLSAAGAIAKRKSAASVCAKYPKGSNEYKACMHRLVHGTKEGEEVDLGQADSYTGRPYDHPKKKGMSNPVDECGGGMGMGRGGHGMGGPGGSVNKGIHGGEIEMGDDDYQFDAEQSPERNDNPRKITNRINHVPNQSGKGLYQSIRQQLGEVRLMSEEKKAEYKAYFNSMLKKFGANSPADLDDEKKKQFFNAVDKGWKSQNESWMKEWIADK